MPQAYDGLRIRSLAERLEGNGLIGKVDKSMVNEGYSHAEENAPFESFWQGSRRKRISVCEMIRRDRISG